MRLFYAVPRSPSVYLPTSTVWHQNFFPTFREMGCEVIEAAEDVDQFYRNATDGAWIRENRPRFCERLYEAIRCAHRESSIDIFFSYFYDVCVTPETIRAIRDLGIVTVNFTCNNAHQFDLVAEISPAFDYCIVPERAALQRYRDVGARAIHLQLAANPNVYHPYALPREYDVTFVGAKYAERPAYIHHLLQGGVSVRVWGPEWAGGGVGAKAVRSIRRVRTLEDLKALGRRALLRIKTRTMDRALRAISGPPLPDEEMVRLYSRSKISLGFSAVGEVHNPSPQIKHLRLRDFEAPMCGAFYLTGHTDEIEEYFEVGKEIVCYIDKDELLDKARYFLRHPEAAERVREMGRRRALSQHTWAHRFQALFRAMDLQAPSGRQAAGETR